MQEQESQRITPADTPAADSAPEARPGVPMEAAPAPVKEADWEEPERQPDAEQRVRRAGLDQPTPVFGTAQPLHGVSGLLRRRAYAIPEHYARHWMLLLLADRVDVLEDRVGGLLAKPLDRVGLHDRAGQVRSNPLPVLAGILAGALIAKRIAS